MGSPYWFKFLINKTFSQRFFWSRLTHYPIIGRAIDYMLFDGDDIMYLPADKVISVNESLDPPESLMAPSKVVEHFIKEAGTCWRMDFCICRDSAHCKDYPVDLGCLFLGDAAKDINPRFGRVISKEEALAHAQKCRDAGLVHLIGRNKLDSVWLNVGPAQNLMTICNCCPCCCLWKILPTVSHRIGDKVSRMPGVSIQVTDKCVGCGTCARDVCFVDAVSLKEGRAIIDENACRGCGRCAAACPKQAIGIIVSDDAYVSHTIKRLEKVVDVT